MGCVESWPRQYAPAGIDGWFVWHVSFDERLDAGQLCEGQYRTIWRAAKSSHRLCRIAIALPRLLRSSTSTTSATPVIQLVAKWLPVSRGPTKGQHAAHAAPASRC